MSENPWTAPAAPAPPRDGTALPSGLWVTLPGALTLLGGALYMLTCVGIPFGVMMILQGIAMVRAGEAADAATRSGDAAHLVTSTAQFVRALRIYGIGLLISMLIGAVVATLIALSAVALAPLLDR